MVDYLARLIRKATRRVPQSRSGRIAFAAREAKPRRAAASVAPYREETVDEAPAAASPPESYAVEPAAVAHEVTEADAIRLMHAAPIAAHPARKAPVITPALVEPMPVPAAALPAPAAREAASVVPQPGPPSDRELPQNVELPPAE